MSFSTNVYFAGSGLVEIGLYEEGVETQQSFELDRECCATQRQNFPHEVVECDLTQKLVKGAKGCEVKIATYPCTKYSSIADIHDCRTGDEMYLHFLRELTVEPPEVYVLENVPGMRKFPVVMEAMTQLPNYFVQAFCPVQSSLWLPQRRDRLIIFGSRRPFAWRTPQSRRRVRLAEILESDPQVTITQSVYDRLNGRYRDQPIISDPEKGDVAPTCVAHYAKDKSTRLVADRRFKHGVRPYSVREYARLQGVPDSFTFTGSANAAYRMIGNGVSVPVGRWIGRELKRYFGR
ncbi:MAG: DNA cytosine methyltransferase [Opitutus sp.]